MCLINSNKKKHCLCVQGKLSGLCGNFDTKTVNEMRTPDNLDSPTPQEFGNSWTAIEVRSISQKVVNRFDAKLHLPHETTL